MAIPFYSDIDLNGNEIKNSITENLVQAPSNPSTGQQYYNTTDNKLYYYNGTEWVDLTTSQSNNGLDNIFYWDKDTSSASYPLFQQIYEKSKTKECYIITSSSYTAVPSIKTSQIFVVPKQEQESNYITMSSNPYCLSSEVDNNIQGSLLSNTYSTFIYYIDSYSINITDDIVTGIVFNGKSSYKVNYLSVDSNSTEAYFTPTKVNQPISKGYLDDRFNDYVQNLTQELTTEDLNDYKSLNNVGINYYAAGGNTVQNKPDSVNNFGLQVLRMGIGVYIQIIYVNTVKIFYRIFASNQWTSWVELLNNTNTYQLLAVPNTFPGAATGTDVTSYINVQAFNKLNIKDSIRITSGTMNNAYIYSEIISMYTYTKDNTYPVKLISFIDQNGNLVRKHLSLGTDNKIYVGESGQNSSGGMACFTGETLVYTNNGYKAIQNIELGDKVYSFNLEQLEYEFKEVDKLINHMTDEIYEITLNNNEIIRTTWCHPFKVLNKEKTLVKDLEIGDQLITKDDKVYYITKIEKLNKQEVVYEIRVKNNYNYFITNSSIFVYNEDSILKD